MRGVSPPNTNLIMKWSRYNAILDYESYEVLYNCMNNNLVALDHKLRILLEENQECIERFENIHPEFYQYLLRKKCVIILIPNRPFI